MKTTLLSLLFASALWGYGDGAIYWAPAPCAASNHCGSKHGGHGMGENTRFTAVNLEENGSAALIKPDLTTQMLAVDSTPLTLPKPTAGGYYALVLNHRSDHKIESAVRYLSLQGRPSKVSPTRLTARPKADFEIVPDPLHREHDHYTASKMYRFVVKLHNKPLPYAMVYLETENNTSLAFKSDASATVEILLPNDFTNVRVGKEDNKPSEFLLYTRYKDGDTLYITTLSMPYYVNPNDYWQSQRYGAGALFIGFLGGILLYRRHKKQGVSRG